MAKVKLKILKISEETYRRLMSVYQRYKDYYDSLDEFIEDLIDTYLLTDPDYREMVFGEFFKTLEELRKRGVDVRVVVG